MEEGFKVHHRKTRIMRQGVRQHLAGIVVNQHMNVGGRTLTGSKRSYKLRPLDPATQNRNAVSDFRLHLAGTGRLRRDDQSR